MNIYLRIIMMVCTNMLTCMSKPLQMQADHLDLFLRSIKKGRSESGLKENKISDALDSYFYANISIGTPPQYFYVKLDTSSADTWVPSIRSNLANTTNGLMYNFYSNRSSTFTPTNSSFEIIYGDGSYASGVLSQDKLILNSFEIPKQIFGEAYKFSDHPDYDGVVGLAFQSVSEFKTANIIDNLFEQNFLEKNIFSFWLDKHEKVGKFFLGESNPDYYSGSFIYADITATAFWQIEIDSISTTDNTICLDCQVILDTSTPLILGPSLQISQLNAAFNASQDANGDFLLNCEILDKLPDVAFTINGNPLILTSKDYVLQIPKGNSPKVCLSLFGFLPTVELDSFWILGSSFIGAFYTEFDFENLRIGFAASVQNDGKSSTTAITTAPLTNIVTSTKSTSPLTTIVTTTTSNQKTTSSTSGIPIDEIINNFAYYLNLFIQFFTQSFHSN